MSRLDTGSLLASMFSVFAANIVPFLLITAIALSPWMLLFIAARMNPDVQLVLALLQSVLSQVATAAIAYGVWQHLRGRDIVIGDCLRKGLQRILPVLAVGILTGLAVGVGTLLFIVPGLIAATMFFVAIPAVVVERTGVIGAIRRSVDLSRGHRWSIFFLLLFLFLVMMGVGLVLGMGLMASGGLGLIAAPLVQILLTALQSTAASLVYYRLRQEKESLDLQEIAAVFA